MQDGSTALYIAAQNGHDTVVNTLLKAGAAVDHADKVCWRPRLIIEFAICCPICVLIYLVSWSLQDGTTALVGASHHGHDTVVHTLLEAGAAVDHAEEVGVLNGLDC